MGRKLNISTNSPRAPHLYPTGNTPSHSFVLMGGYSYTLYPDKASTGRTRPPWRITIHNTNEAPNHEDPLWARFHTPECSLHDVIPLAPMREHVYVGGYGSLKGPEGIWHKLVTHASFLREKANLADAKGKHEIAEDFRNKAQHLLTAPLPVFKGVCHGLQPGHVIHQSGQGHFGYAAYDEPDSSMEMFVASYDPIQFAAVSTSEETIPGTLPPVNLYELRVLRAMDYPVVLEDGSVLPSVATYLATGDWKPRAEGVELIADLDKPGRPLAARSQVELVRYMRKRMPWLTDLVRFIAGDRDVDWDNPDSPNSFFNIVRTKPDGTPRAVISFNDNRHSAGALFAGYHDVLRVAAQRDHWEIGADGKPHTVKFTVPGNVKSMPFNPQKTSDPRL